MYETATRRWLAVAGFLCVCAGCSSKSPEEVEAERARANAAWNAQAAVAERARSEEEKKLVEQQIAEHERQALVDEEHEIQAELSGATAEQERALDLVRAKYPDPAAARFTGVHWNASKSALCGEVSVPNGQGIYSPFAHFIVNGDVPVIDSESEEEHARFATAAQSIDCSP